MWVFSASEQPNSSDQKSDSTHENNSENNPGNNADNNPDYNSEEVSENERFLSFFYEQLKNKYFSNIYFLN